MPELALDPLLEAAPHRPRDQRRRHQHGQRRRRQRRQEDLRAEGHGGPSEPVAELLDRHDGVGEERQLLAQPADVHVDRARAAGVLVAPDVGQQQVARQHAAAVLEQVLQEQELLRGQRDFLAVHLDGVPLESMVSGP